MTEDMMKNFNEQMQKMGMGPARDAAKLGVDHLEQLFSLQLEAAKTYADLALKEARAALEVDNPEALKAYVEHQRELANTVSQRVKSDAEKVVALNQGFAEKVQKMGQDAVAKSTKK